jgi:Oxidoreductase molybdopterin binding domain
MVEKPLIFTLADLKRFLRVNRIYFLECAANSGMEWRGAQLNGCQRASRWTRVGAISATEKNVHCLVPTSLWDKPKAMAAK